MILSFITLLILFFLKSICFRFCYSLCKTTNISLVLMPVWVSPFTPGRIGSAKSVQAQSLSCKRYLGCCQYESAIVHNLAVHWFFEMLLFHFILFLNIFYLHPKRVPFRQELFSFALKSEVLFLAKGKKKNIVCVFCLLSCLFFNYLSPQQNGVEKWRLCG